MGHAYHGVPLFLMSVGGNLDGDENWGWIGRTENERGGGVFKEARDPPVVSIRNGGYVASSGMSGAWVRRECRLSTGAKVVLKYTLSLCQPPDV